MPLALAVAAASIGGSPVPAEAQRIEPADARFWGAAAATIALAAVFDDPLRDGLRSRGGSEGIDDVSRVGDALGRGAYIVPGLALSYLSARVARRERWARATLHVAAGYAAANLVVSALKPVVGRERPYTSGSPGGFHPFTQVGDYHSFPSGHVAHAAAIAVGVTEYAGERRRWVAPLCYGAVGLVAWQRMYADQHWASDAAAGATVGVVASTTVLRWLERRAARDSGDGTARLRVMPLPGLAGGGGVGLALTITR